MNKCFVFASLLALIGFSCAALAVPADADEPINLGKCSYLDDFKQGFDKSAYQACVTKINQCTKNGPYLDETCVQKTMNGEANCQQLNILAKEINASPEFIQAEQQAHFTILDVTFPADGGHEYAILSPQGCLIDTVVDPRDLSPAIKKKYAKNDFYLEAKKKPVYKQLPDSTHQFTVQIQAKNQCRACAVIGTAKIAFNFSKTGEWKKTELLSFLKS